MRGGHTIFREASNTRRQKHVIGKAGPLFHACSSAWNYENQVSLIELITADNNPGVWFWFAEVYLPYFTLRYFRYHLL